MLNIVFSRFVASFIDVHSKSLYDTCMHIVRRRYRIRMRVDKPEIHESEKLDYNHGKIKETAPLNHGKIISSNDANVL